MRLRFRGWTPHDVDILIVGWVIIRLLHDPFSA
jgi:hypothetical protein